MATSFEAEVGKDAMAASCGERRLVLGLGIKCNQVGLWHGFTSPWCIHVDALGPLGQALEEACGLKGGDKCNVKITVERIE